MDLQVAQFFSALVASVQQGSIWRQLLLIVLIFIIGYTLNFYLQRQLNKDQSTGLRHMAVRSSQRIFLPFSLALMLWIATEVFEYLKMPGAWLQLLLPITLALGVIRLLVYMLRKAFLSSPLVKSMEPMLTLTIWFLVVLHLAGWLQPLQHLLDQLAITLGSNRISLWTVIKLLMVISLAFTLAVWLSGLINQRLKTIYSISPSMRVGLSKFSKVFLVLIAFLVALNAAGIDLSSLAIFGGALGVGLGFGLQRIASNFVSGFILVMDRSVKPGDIITVGDKFGWVEQLNSRYVVLRNRQGVDTLIPNENLIITEVINWSYADRNVRLEINVQISYDDDPELAMQLMLDCAFASPRVIADPVPAVRLMSFADNGMHLQLRVWIADMENGSGSVKSDINLAIWRAFKAHQITIPYPQRDLHLKTAMPWPPAPAPTAAVPDAED